jgi:hypothetical protein
MGSSLSISSTFSNTFFSCAGVRRILPGRMKGGSEAPSELSEVPCSSWSEEEISSPGKVSNELDRYNTN